MKKRGFDMGRATIPLALVVLALALSACKGATISSGARTSDLKLAFSVMGSGTSASSEATKSVSALILPGASSLSVSLTPIGVGLSPAETKTVSLSASAPATVGFSDIIYGTYSIEATAKGSGLPDFHRSATVTIDSSETKISLNLVPANPDTTTLTGNAVSVSFSLAVNEIKAFQVPAAYSRYGEAYWPTALGYSLPSWLEKTYALCPYSSEVGYTLIALDADGSLIVKGTVNSNGTFAVTSGAAYQYSISGYTFVGIGPCSTSEPSYLILINGSIGNYVGMDLNQSPPL